MMLQKDHNSHQFLSTFDALQEQFEENLDDSYCYRFYDLPRWSCY